MTPITPTILTVRQLTNLYDVSKSTLYRWLDNITHFKVGEKVYVDAKDFERYVKEHKIESKAEIESIARGYKRK